MAAFSSLMIAAPAGAQVNGYHRNQSAVTSLKSNGYRGNHSVITGWYGFYGSQYAVTFGQGYYVRVYRVAASEIDHLLYQRFISQGHNGHGASVLTLRWLRENLDLNLPASIAANVFGFWSFFTDSEWGDFQEALRNTVVNDACLLLHAEPGVPFVDQYNWTWALSDCNYGRPFIPS